jgi:hypothetical protein
VCTHQTVNEHRPRLWRIAVPSRCLQHQVTASRRNVRCLHGLHKALLSTRTPTSVTLPGTADRSPGTVRYASSEGRSLNQPTTYALSTAPGRAAIAVTRVSGPACLDIYRALCPGKGLPKARYATVRTLYEPNKPSGTDAVLDASALVLYFPAPRTVTGEGVLVALYA